MDAKITKERISRMLSYDWLKIIGLCVAAIFFWTLVFTVSATRITTAQQFTVINYFGNAGMVNTSFSKDFTKAFNDGLFSYEVIDISEVDVGGNAEMGATLMQTRVATEEGDVVFVPDLTDAGSEYEINGEKYQDTYLQNLVRNYGWNLENLDRKQAGSFFNRLEAFLNEYYGNYAEENATLNTEKVKQDFLARVAKNKDKRFKTDAQKEKGIRDEIKRVEKYRNALIEFDGYLESGLVQLTATQVRNIETGELSESKVYSINICPNPEKMPNLIKIAGYWVEVLNEAGEKQSDKLSALNMNVAIMRFEGMEGTFEFESLLYINHVIRTGKTQ